MIVDAKSFTVGMGDPERALVDLKSF